MTQDDFWNEEWRVLTLPEITEEEIYEVSTYGRVRSTKKGTDKFKMLKSSNQKKDGTGYMYFRFKSNKGNNDAMTKAMHRIVADLYITPPGEDYIFVVHKDYNKSNNSVSNLEWVTRSGLVAHNKKNPNVLAGHERTKGLIRRAKLTETEVIRLKKKLKRGKTKLYKIAKEFGITHTQLNRIRSGENWGHVKVD